MPNLKSQPADMIVGPCKACEINHLEKPMIIGTSVDPVIVNRDPYTPWRDPKLDQLLGVTGQPSEIEILQSGEAGLVDDTNIFLFGDDIKFGVGRKPTEANIDVSEAGWFSDDTKEEVLLDRVNDLVDIFATFDFDGVAKRIFDKMFKDKSSKVRYHQDQALNEIASKHGHIEDFMKNAMQQAGKHRIHDALKQADWDINQIDPVTRMGLVPAFDHTIKLTPLWMFNTGDGTNGLSVAVNSIQHVIMVATGYHYNQCTKRYKLDVTYVLYDVFGIDDLDIIEYGADGGGWDWDASKGIMAWWQLQHQYNYAPLITRMEFDKSYDVEAI